MTKVFIDGQAGTTGLKLAERLQARSDLQLIQIDEAARKNKQARRQCIAEADIASLSEVQPSARSYARTLYKGVTSAGAAVSV